MKKQPAKRYKEFSIGQLRAFFECFRRRSFSSAARELRVSQPAIWQQVRALERDFGAPLLEKTASGLEPTQDGVILFEQIAPILGAVDGLKESFDDRRRDAIRQLVVIGSPGVIIEELARPIAEFVHQHQSIELTLANNVGVRSLDVLLTGDADLAILPGATEFAVHSPLVASEALYERSWAVATPADHPLVTRKKVSLADVVRYPLILPEKGTGWRRQLDGAIRGANIETKLRIVVEVSMSLAMRRFVSLGLGVAVFQAPMDGIEVPNVVVRPLHDMPYTESVVVISRRGSQPSPQADLFINFIRAWIAKSKLKDK